MIWVGWLICIAVLLQTVELFWVKPWSWHIISKEIPKLLRPFLKSNNILLSARLIAAIAALLSPHPIFILVLLLTTWGIAIRWRGTFNGGSDAMTFQILLAWLVAASRPDWEYAALLYIVAQLILSYFIAGVSKLKNSEWRRGQALPLILRRYGVEVSAPVALALTCALIAFEVLFPLSLVWPAFFVTLAFIFHLANVYVFGLNRFFFAWLAAYPALFLVTR